MVKNKKGGKRHKRMASKNTHAPSAKAMLRKVVDEGEMYAVVTQLFGNGMADVLCNDGVTRLLIIRRKFRGRNRRDNQIKRNSIVLIGLRRWEVVGADKKSKVDLLYIYSESQVTDLVKLEDLNQKILPEELRTETQEIQGFDMKISEDWKGEDEKIVAGALVEDTLGKTPFGEDFTFDDI